MLLELAKRDIGTAIMCPADIRCHAHSSAGTTDCIFSKTLEGTLRKPWKRDSSVCGGTSGESSELSSWKGEEAIQGLFLPWNLFPCAAEVVREFLKGYLGLKGRP